MNMLIPPKCNGTNVCHGDYSILSRGISCGLGHSGDAEAVTAREGNMHDSPALLQFSAERLPGGESLVKDLAFSRASLFFKVYFVEERPKQTYDGGRPSAIHIKRNAVTGREIRSS